jgi:hypothetical protein
LYLYRYFAWQGVGESVECEEVGLTVHNISMVPGQHYNLTTLHLSSQVFSRFLLPSCSILK